jgi:hypothetical protein
MWSLEGFEQGVVGQISWQTQISEGTGTKRAVRPGQGRCWCGASGGKVSWKGPKGILFFPHFFALCLILVDLTDLSKAYETHPVKLGS